MRRRFVLELPRRQNHVRLTTWDQRRLSVPHLLQLAYLFCTDMQTNHQAGSDASALGVASAVDLQQLLPTAVSHVHFAIYRFGFLCVLSESSFRAQPAVYH
jgi:hypothetical protein